MPGRLFLWYTADKVFQFIVIILLAIPCSWADDFFSPPELDPQAPPWIQEAQRAQNAGDTKTGPDTPNLPPKGFWGEEEEGIDYPAASPSRSGGNAQSKDSFKLVEPWNDVLGDDAQTQSCLGWGHPFLGVTMYQKQNSCEFVLNQKLEESKQSIRSLEDHTRSLVLKQVIKGNIKRAASKNFQLKYDLLMDILLEAKREGCRCLN